MKENQEFLVLRYSLVEELQRTLLAKDIPTPKGAAVLVSIMHDREFVLNGTRYGFVGFSEIRPASGYSFPAARFYVGKTAKLKKAHMGIKVPGDILETEEDDWLPVITIIDIDKQYIPVRKDWRFGSPEQTMHAIQAGLRDPIMDHYNHRVFVEGITRREHFWRVISAHKCLYKLELKLIAPNILETNLKAREALAALKNLFAQDEVSINLTNESGSLQVPENPIANYLEYIEEGEGSWSLTTEGLRGGKKKHSSRENTDIVEISVPETVSADPNRQLELLPGKPAQRRDAIEVIIVEQAFAQINAISER